jgi:putative phosphoesterase
VLLGVLSDTHNNQANLEAALEIFRRRGVTELIHCGDVTHPDLLLRLDGFRVHLVYGNGDFATGEMLDILRARDPENTAGEVFTGQIDGVAVAAAHGHERLQLDALVQSGRYAFVFRGHSHRRQDSTLGPTRLVNPGGLGGLNRETRSICLVDLVTLQIEFIPV